MNALIKMDKSNILYFSPLQSSFAKTTIEKKYIEKMDSVIVKVGDKVYTKSTAAFVVLNQLNSPLKYLFYFCPTSLADFIYNIIANRRYSWFGKKEECIFPLNNPKFLIKR
jgi:predicted DCC family thiol-disulfide oxidoreductase YuxK